MHGSMKLRPREIRRLTIPEVALALDHDLEKQRPPAGSRVFGSDEEQMAYARWLRGLSVEERLRLTREGVL